MYVCDELLCVAFCVFKKCSYVVFVVVEFYMKTAHHKTVRAAGGGANLAKTVTPSPNKNHPPEPWRGPRTTVQNDQNSQFACVVSFVM